MRPQPLSTTVIPADTGRTTTRASLVQAVMDKVHEVMLQQDREEEEEEQDGAATQGEGGHYRYSLSRLG